MPKMTLIMTNIRPETPEETRKGTRKEARSTETRNDAHGTIRTLQSHVSAVTSLQTENHLEDNIHSLETPLQTPNIDLLGAFHPVTVIETETVTETETETETVSPLIDPAAPQLMQATMREIDDVQAIAHSLAKQTTAMVEGATKTDAVMKTDAVTKTDTVTKTEVVTKTDTVTGIVHLLI